ncbi:hypothetical protein [Nocardia sp. NPDC024068]|uniref:hypothetical protein n=1 Tax=Nocardia sp. NPDC024068 TaxID=3157197 RepID=UPI0033E62EAE
MHGRYLAIRLLPLIAVFCLCIASTGCATGGGSNTTDTEGAGWTEAQEITYTSDFPVQQELTETRALTQILQHLTTTANALPNGASLTPRTSVRRGDTSSESPADPKLVPSCLLDDKVIDAPHKLIVLYQLHGTAGMEAEYLKQIKTVWEQLGWDTGYKAGWEIVEEETDVVQTQTPDHYTLVAQEIAGRRSIAVTSPCFPHTGVGGSGALPEEVRHR